MNRIGIDMSKDTFHVAFDPERVIVFENNDQGIQNFIKEILNQGMEKTNVIIGTESTGVYHLLLCNTLRRHGWKIKVINPLITHRMINTSLRRLKTDKHDAVAIRECLGLEVGHLYTDTPEILALKTLASERESLSRMKAGLKQRMHAHKVKAKASGLPLHDSFTGPLKIFVYEIKEIEKMMSQYLPEIQKLLRSIPGIGVTSAGALVAYIGDIKRFDRPEKLVAYIGLDPRVHESGTSIHGNGYISKRGNKYLRYILWNAAFIARQKNPDLKVFFEKKLGEGKHHFKALVAVERKLIHLIWAVWTRGTPFEKR
jgi:transposase